MKKDCSRQKKDLRDETPLVEVTECSSPFDGGDIFCPLLKVQEN